MPNPLPQFVSSLSKYYRAEDHYPLVASILRDTPESELRARFGENLYATGRKRYLIVENRIVIKDKLVDLIHEEDGFTERVKMVMYFLFMFRDARYRQFICQNVANREGKWQTEIFRDPGADHFEGAGGHKAFTNLRQFLFQTGVLAEDSLRVHMPDLRLWFPAAAEIAAQAIDDETAKKNFLADPTSFLVRYKINALLNASPKELSQSAFSLPLEEHDLSAASELPEVASEPEASTFRVWNRLPPSRRSRVAKVIETDPAALERANDRHYFLEKRISDLCSGRGLTPRNNIHIDLVVDHEDMSVVFEMKSCGAGAVRNQLRRAISQLLEYGYIYRSQLKRDVFLCAVLERKPAGRVAWLLGYADSLGIGVIWKNNQNETLTCTEPTKNRLKEIFPEVKADNF